MGINHVEMPLVNRKINRLTDRAARVMHPGGHLGQLHEVLEIDDRGVATPPLEIRDERRTVGRGENHTVTTNGDARGGIPAKHLKYRWGGGTKRADEAWFESSPLAVHPRASLPEKVQRLTVVDLHADLVEDPVGVFLQTDQVVLVEEFVGGDGAPERLRRSDEGRKQARGCSRGPSSPAAPYPLIGSALGFQGYLPVGSGVRKRFPENR